MRIYNRQEDEFDDSEQYNLYLEEIEQTVYNLTYDFNKLETEKKLEIYEKAHREEIKRNVTKK